MRNGNFKITLHMSQFKSPHLRGDLGHFEFKKKIVFEQHIPKQKLILNDSSDYKFSAKIIYTVILRNALSADMKNS